MCTSQGQLRLVKTASLCEILSFLWTKSLVSEVTELTAVEVSAVAEWHCAPKGYDKGTRRATDVEVGRAPDVEVGRVPDMEVGRAPDVEAGRGHHGLFARPGGPRRRCMETEPLFVFF
jgi:hypothetical protein